MKGDLVSSTRFVYPKHNSWVLYRDWEPDRESERWILQQNPTLREWYRNNWESKHPGVSWEINEWASNRADNFVWTNGLNDCMRVKQS